MKYKEKMPALFLGHGSPMIALEKSEFTQNFKALAEKIPKPKAIVCISAHWVTNGTFITAMQKPKTIHDFYGFPKELYDVKYPVNGDVNLARHIENLSPNIHLDTSWGLDHGTWTILKHMYPNADIPVLQLSLDGAKDAKWHYDFAKVLEPLRNEGVLIIGSGNIIHNLRLTDFNSQKGHPWAKDVQKKITDFIKNSNHKALIEYEKQGREFMLSIPTPEHFLPLLYILSLQKDENIKIFNAKIVLGAISMHSVMIGDF